MVEFILNFVKSLILKFGYLGVFGLMFADTLNIPAASEITLIFTGFLVSLGYLNIYFAVLVAVLANFFGAILNFNLGRLGEKILIKEDHIHRGQKFLNKFGKASAFIGYILPVVRSFIAFPLGFLGFSFIIFAPLALAGQFLWAVIFISLGIFLGSNWQNVLPFLHRLDIITLGVLLLITAAVIYVKKTKKPQK